MNVKLFKSQMVLHEDTISSLSQAIGMSRPTLSAKIHGKTDFTQSEINFIKNRWKLPPALVDSIFFKGGDQDE